MMSEITRVFAIATDSAGCWWYRLHLPLSRLTVEEHGIEVLWRWPSEGDLAGASVDHPIVVIGQRIAGHSPRWLALCTDPRVHVIYELDDDIVDVDPANAVPHSIFAPQREGTIANITRADHVIVATRELLTRVWDRWNPQVTWAPNCLDPAWLGLPDRRERQDQRITVGWAGSMFHAQDWPRELVEALRRAKARESRLRFHAIGADYMGGLADRFTPWGPMPGHVAALDFDIGLAPLARSPFNQAKSHAKLLEYGSRGIPAIASPVGEYPAWVEGSPDDDLGAPRPGILAHEVIDFEAAIAVLSDDDVRAIMGRAARERATRFTIDLHLWRWLRAINSRD